MRAHSNRELDKFRFTVRPLSSDEGGGYLVEYPDIPGCMSDGETIEEAIANGREALRDCLEVFRESGRKPVKPNIEAAQWRQRLPRTPPNEGAIDWLTACPHKGFFLPIDSESTDAL